MRPPFAYYGGKVGLGPKIAELFPAHRVYIEPFFGSGAVLFAKRPAVIEIANDIDGNVVTFFRVLRERPEDLERLCRLTPHARAEYFVANLDEDLGDLERARRFWVRVNQSFAKTARKRTGWSITTARTQSIPGSIAGRIDRFHACAERLAEITFENCDAGGLVERLASSPDTLVYCDPPYVSTTRNSGSTPTAADYLHDMGSEAEHRRLAEVLHATPAVVFLSGYPSPLYEDLYGDWEHIDFAVTVHSSNAAASSGRGGRVERIWTNRPVAKSNELSFAEVSA